MKSVTLTKEQLGMVREAFNQYASATRDNVGRGSSVTIEMVVETDQLEDMLDNAKTIKVTLE